MSENSDTSAQDNNCHSTHSFECHLSNKKVIAITCSCPGTVENSLRTSLEFRKLQEKNKVKELVVLKCGRPIASHAPCTMIQAQERLKVQFVNPVGLSSYKKAHSSKQRVEFNVVTKGGQKITRIIRNPRLRSHPQITVYAFKGEKVKNALKRDGRFFNTVFLKTCGLSDTRTNVITELSSLVDGLDGKTLQVILLSSCTPPESQPSSFEDFDIPNDSHCFDHDKNHSVAVAASQLKDDTNLDVNKLKLVMHDISGSKELCSRLNTEMRAFFENMCKDHDYKSVALPEVYELFCVNYGRSQVFSEAKTAMALGERCRSVCQVRINGSPAGSGFLLFDTFVLTAAHVLEEVFDKNTGHLSGTVTVHFSFISLEQLDPGHQVQEVVAFEHGTDVSGHSRDWTLLKLGSDEGLPSSLLIHCGFVPQSSKIWLIGHPHGGIKLVEVTLIIPGPKRPQIVETHFNENLSGLPEPNHSAVEEHDNNNPPVIKFLADAKRFCFDVAITANSSRNLMYESCFYFGASGCPVFDTYFNVIAMHSGGFVYKGPSGQFHSIIEYGHSVLNILENMLVQLVRTGRLDVLKKYLLSPNKHHTVIINNVKKLVSSRNYTEFKQAAGSFNVGNDEILNKFFQFICDIESPEPMDNRNDSGNK